ncbi:tyrosine-type recombinase/integrase [Streptomyces botrytidirepellens]|uniref:tyrosine-type recombinase/integrase n=1 Tax=Streptomyces botrytidirepellens TaxID=2486417 RepID=UPI003CCC5A95
MRHTGLTWMADAGVPVHVLQKIAGHGSLSTTQRCLHPSRRSIHLAGAALSSYLSTGQQAVGPKLVPEPRTCLKPHPCWSRRANAAVGPPVNRDRRGPRCRPSLPTPALWSAAATALPDLDEHAHPDTAPTEE